MSTESPHLPAKLLNLLDKEGSASGMSRREVLLSIATLIGLEATGGLHLADMMTEATFRIIALVADVSTDAWKRDIFSATRPTFSNPAMINRTTTGAPAFTPFTGGDTPRAKWEEFTIQLAPHN